MLTLLLRSSRDARLLGAALVLTGLFPCKAGAQLQVARLHGTVLDVQATPTADATVRLEDPSGNVIRTALTGADGTFDLADVAPGAYAIRVQVEGRVVLTRALVVRGALPVELTLRTGLSLAESIVVRGDAGSNTAERPWSLAGDAVRRGPEAIPSQRVQAALASLPGWMSEDNGLLHVRGVDDGLLYVQDGIPVYARLDRLFGMPPNASGIASLHVLNGYIPPEFGFKSGAVVEVRTETGMRSRWTGTFDTGVADLATRHVDGFAAGPLGGGAGLMLTGADERSSRFLDPVSLENLHNEGRSSSLAAQLTVARPSNLLTVAAQGGRDIYDVPHGLEQEAAGQDQRQRTTQYLVSGSWQRVLSTRTVWQASGYARDGAATLHASPDDTPVTAGGRRADRRYGALASLTHQRARHTIKVGGELSRLRLDERFTFAVTNPGEAEEAGLSDAAISHGPDDPFDFGGRRRAELWSAYAQDLFEVSPAVTVNFGVRFDRSTLLLHSTQWSPRLGAAWRVREGTTVRGSWLRLFQPPQAEYLLLASSPEARRLSPFADDGEIGGGSDVPPERQSAVDASVVQALPGGLTLDGSAWLRRARDVGDPNVFFGTTVTVPNSVARHHASGVDVRIAMAPRGRWSGSVSYAHARVVQFGPVTGGLFLEDEVAVIQDGTRFIPDHDQRHSLVSNASYAHAGLGLRVSGVFRYQTGTPVAIEGDDLADLVGRPGSQTVDFETGRVKPRAIADLLAEWSVVRGRRADATLSFFVNNATNQTYAFNYGNPFSGTHFGAGRRIGIALRLAFR